MFKIGIDVGGTFTDLVVVREGQTPYLFKTHSTPHDPSIGVISGLGDVAKSFGISLSGLLGDTELIIHGTTVATNTLLERKGSKVGLITTEGFRDLLEMREGMKEDRYNLRMQPLEPLVPRYLRLGVDERIRSNGDVVTPLSMRSLRDALDILKKNGAESIAVCFLFSYLSPDHEKLAAQVISEEYPDMYTSLSHEILPQIKEFDRLSTTVINSYVGPVFGQYLQQLKDRLTELEHQRSIYIMQSNGGVASIDASTQQAVRAILSGPAGGVSGASYYGQLIGADKVIGFDMGGTSADISLIENGAPHLTSEQLEAGWKIAVPMIDIQTLGAGGGSIAQVDLGGILRVGPQSAGASPGPACYGKGGTQPTVTDASLVMGYLDPNKFLGGKDTLDISLAEQTINKDVAGPLRINVEEAAYGIHQIVSTAMAEGIRLLSARRGVDPRDFAIVAFGGASGLHISRVARELQIRHVHLPAAGPVLSAYGMLSTDLRIDLSRSYPSSLDNLDIDVVRSIVSELESEGQQKLSEQQDHGGQIETVVTADMRYLDQIYEVNVPVPQLDLELEEFLDHWASNFHKRFEELFSYRQQNQEIRLITLRVTAFSRLPRIEMPLLATTKPTNTVAQESRSMYLGNWLKVPVYAMDCLTAGEYIEGPALLESDFTSILVESGDIATIDPFGGIHLTVATDQDAKEARDIQEYRPDPVTVSVVEQRLESIAQEMVEVMLRTSMSQILNSSHDFSTVILDPKGQMVAQGEGIPVHMSALPIAAQSVQELFIGDIHPGDLFLINDPYFGGSHLPDITVIWPIFHKDQLLFFSVNRAHHSDVGGATHGGYNPAASEIYHEGIRIPPVKIYANGVPRQDVIRLLAANVRHPENFIGDLNAQIGSVMTASRRIEILIERYGPNNLSRYSDEMLDATERRIRQMISGWPDGVYKGESLIDNDGFGATNIPIRATVTILGDQMTIDLSESSPQVTGFINSSYANTRSAAHAAIMYLAPSDIPKNEGSMRPVKIIAPKGIIVNANPPAPVAMSTNHCAEEIIEAVFQALSESIPEAVNAGFSRRLRYAITAVDPRSNRQFIWHFFLARGGGGASSGFDGWSGVGEVNVAGGIRSPSIEVTEERFPLFIKNHEMRPNSGGDGTWRGGLGGICEIVYEGTTDARLNTAGDGTINPPSGLFKGKPGLPHTYSIISNGVERFLKSKEEGLTLHPGDIIRVLSAGGGGYGPPEDRDPDARKQDVLNGYVT
ncbi:hypothetical protein FIM12_00655 [SAR202 cluster bacterium AD-804-J14_MRT_500m]|nr:hypothetical protein [SAR202 cluster bacterium AD-804-J14_MRT_500m]